MYIYNNTHGVESIPDYTHIHNNINRFTMYIYNNNNNN